MVMTALIPCKRYGATTIIFVAFVFICLLLFVLKGRIFLMKQHYDNDNNNNDENTNYMTAIQDQMKHFSSDLPTIILQDGNWEEDYILYDLMSAVPTCYDSWKERKFCFGVNGSKVFDLQTTMKDFKTYNLLRLSGKQISNIHLYQQLFPTPSSSQNKYILVFSSNQSRKDRSQRSLLDELLKVAKYLQPRVIIQLSDEKGDKPEYMQLAAVCNLYLRQYYHAHYPVHTAWDARTVHIPLGYTLGMFEKKSSLSDAVMNVSSIAKSYLESITNKIRDRNSNRHLVWTFIGIFSLHYNNPFQ